MPHRSNSPLKFDLEERTAKFSEKVIDFVRKIPKNQITFSTVSQLVRSATSIGANYCEADEAESGKDFKHKLGIAKKEARETKYWLRIIVKTAPNLKDEARGLWQEAKELDLIFNSIIHKIQNKKNRK